MCCLLSGQQSVKINASSNFSKMDKFEIHAVIKYFFLKGLTDITDIKKELDSSPSNTTVKRWVAEFKMGRKSINDEPRSGRPIEVTTAEKAKTVERRD
jgi:transposase